MVSLLSVVVVLLPALPARAQTTAPTLAVNDVRLNEGNSGTKTATFTITRSGTATGASSVQWATANGTAAAGTDYVAVAATAVSFAAGETSKSVTVTINGDTAVEANETFFVRLSSPVGATIADDSGTGTITNDDTGFSVNNVSLTEGNSGTKAATFAITRSGITTGTGSIRWATADGTATAGTDYVAIAPTTLSYAAGETSKNVAVTVNGDTAVEANETFFVRLSSPVGGTIADGSGTGTITNDDTALAINDVSVAEGNSGTKTATFTITRSGRTTGTSSVRIATADGTATGGSDFVAVAPTTLSFAAGETSKPVTVTVNGDTAVETDETFLVQLSSPVGATIADGSGTGTITNDDAGYAVNDVTLTEGNSGTKTATLSITRSGMTTGTSSVQWATANGTATGGSDFVAVAPTTVSFGDGETSKPVTVTVNGDTAVEANETFFVRLSSPVGATIADGSGTGRIVNDDTALAIDDVTLTEGDAGTKTATFAITRTGKTTGTSSVQWATANGTATGGDDFVAVAPTPVNFAAGETSKPVTVTVNGDTELEDAETFFVRLSSSVGATIADESGTGTITNDDTGFAVNDVTVTEGNSGTKAATFTITRSGTTTSPASVQWATANGTATGGTDFVATAPTTLSFAAGETSKNVAVTIKGDTTVEPNETFFVRLSSPVGATIADGSGTGTITNDDTGFAVNDVTLTEGNAGTKSATFTISRSGTSTGTSSVQWATANGTATGGSDFVAVAPTTVSFGPGDTSKPVAVTIKGDTAVEADETFSVRLSNPVGGKIVDPSGSGTIANDDVALAIDDASVVEGDSGTRTITFVLRRTGDVSGTSCVQWSMADGTATAGSDYVGAPPTSVCFAAGETTKTIVVVINGDTEVEPDETFRVILSSPQGGGIIDGSATGTITNDDATLAINDLSLTEDNAGTKAATFTITRSGATSGPSSVQWSTADGTATAGSDYVAVGPATATFAAGETTKAVTVTINGDTAVEPDETFVVNLSSPVGAAITDGSGTGTITNDDTALVINDASVTEGHSGAGQATFTITRSGATSGPSSVQWATADGTATAGSDYVAVAPAMVNFASGEVTRTVTVTVNGDTAIEVDETFFVRLSSPQGATIADDSGTGTIANDDTEGPRVGTPWVVTLGDSFMSGEAGRWAGNTSSLHYSAHDAGGEDAYHDNGNTGEAIEGCHRSESAEAYIFDGEANALNLACSGAGTSTGVADDGRFKPGIDNYLDDLGRKGQARLLEEFARTHNVRLVPLSIGGNNFEFAKIVERCFWGFMNSPMWAQWQCSQDSWTLGHFTPEYVAQRTAEIATAIGEVRNAMSRAGYFDADYTILVQDYVSPISTGANMRYGEGPGWGRQITGGCGLWNADVDWMNSTALSAINGAVRAAAAQSGLPNVRFLELERAFEGKALCDKRVGLLEEKGLSSWTDDGAALATEWVNQIRTVTAAGEDDEYDLQENFHPNYWGQKALRNCLRSAYNGGAPQSGRCTQASGVNGAGEPNMFFATPTTVPHVVGLDFGEASDIVEAAGLVVYVTNEGSCEPPPNPNEVLDQSPNGGTRLFRGDAVTLTLWEYDCPGDIP